MALSAYFASLSLLKLIKNVPGGVAQGLIWGLMALGVYITFRLLDAADLIIAKGQGNFETLRYCGRNVYYLFLCKCPLFAGRFGVPLYTGMLVNDRRLQKE